jgi:16S rRNA (cytosine1402-N4)-methyltransferase
MHAYTACLMRAKSEAPSTLLHKSVMVNEVLDLLVTKPGGNYVDGTIGAGGHTAAILEKAGSDSRVLGIDRDPDALNWSKKTLNDVQSQITLVLGKFSEIADICNQYGFENINGVLLDLGLSSMQIERSNRGFSFMRDEALDMRMNPDSELTAEQIINEWEPSELARIIREYGEEQNAKKITRQIIRNRPIATTGELVRTIETAVGSSSSKQRKKHPATKTFQALRITVNDELTELKNTLQTTRELLSQTSHTSQENPRLAIISFHSLEDRLVKSFFRHESSSCICSKRLPICTCQHIPTLKELTRKPIAASQTETDNNPRARSARLRVAEIFPKALSE